MHTVTKKLNGRKANNTRAVTKQAATGRRIRKQDATTNKLYIAIGARIKQARNMYEMTLDQLANQIGVSRAAISQFELAVHKPSRPRPDRLARVFGTSAQWFLDGTGSPPRRVNKINEHCQCEKCLEDLPIGRDMAQWARLAVGWTAEGLQVWCLRHQRTVLDLGFKNEVDLIAGKVPARVRKKSPQVRKEPGRDAIMAT
jgi:transcriptional regulator with XRE-family HTH domain